MRVRLLRLLGVCLGMVTLALLAFALLGDKNFRSPPLFDESLPAGAAANLAVAPPDEALTFARVSSAGGPRLLLVERFQGGQVAGVDLSALFAPPDTDPIALFTAVGYDRIVGAVDPAAPRVEVPAETLLVPFATGLHHVAAGTNYPEHGEEVNIDSPFLFPKLGAITPPVGEVARRDALLDYEVELGLVLLADQPLDGSAPPALGLTLVNDLTDRERLVRGLNLLDIDAGAGFPDAKSRDGFLPVGSFLVIPRDWRTYAANLKLELYVNGRLRQRSPTAAMIWTPEQIVRQVAARRNWTFPYQSGTIALTPPGDVLAARTIILTGTPEGVVFRPPTVRQIMAGIPPYALSFAWATRSPLDSYLAGAHASGAFLQPGDELLLRAEGLGILRTTVTP